MRFDGVALKRIREERGLSQRQLAAAVGVDATAISRLETGSRVDPKATTLAMIVEALGGGHDTYEQLIHE